MELIMPRLIPAISDKSSTFILSEMKKLMHTGADACVVVAHSNGAYPIRSVGKSTEQRTALEDSLVGAPFDTAGCTAILSCPPSKQDAKYMATERMQYVVVSRGTKVETQEVKGETGADTVASRDERPGYGSFGVHAAAEQELKKVLRKQPGWEKFNDSQKSAMEMIAHKMARLLNNAPEHLDSWHDIAGYATLAEQEIIKQSSKTET